MSSFYIHIPFCRKACHYCDFHFSTSLKKKDEMILALANEIVMRKNEVQDQIETIYFGGGTPSVLSVGEIIFLINQIRNNYQISVNPEITIEANPDDLTFLKIRELSQSPINRLSIGIQSFFDDDLTLMNRSHNAEQSKNCLKQATDFVENISVDLIYGIPKMSDQKWLENIETALSFQIPHLSCYALTVEPKTALEKLIESGKIPKPTDKTAENHFRIVIKKLLENEFIHYELSNFGKKGYFSKNNTSYWQGKKYIGIGPSAHSYNQTHRSWNVANNSIYISEIKNKKLPKQTERLTISDKYNEYIMTGLRTIWGISLDKIRTDFGENYCHYLIQNAKKSIENGFLKIDNQTITITEKGKFLSDGLASQLFFVEK